MYVLTKDLMRFGEYVGQSSEDFMEGNLPDLEHEFDLLAEDGDVLFSGVSDDTTDTEALDEFGYDHGAVEIKYKHPEGGYYEDRLS